MKTLAKMYSFSTKLWYDKRWINKSGEASLYLQVTLNRQHKVFPLKIKWPVDLIDMVNGELLPKKRGDRSHQDYNMAIRQEQGRHNEIVLTYRLKKANIDIEKFSREVKVYDSKISFAAFMARETLKRFNRKEITRRTWLNHNTAYLKMVEFNPVWSFDELTVAWMKRFKQSLLNKGYMHSYVWTLIKTVKTYMVFTEFEPMMHIDEEVVKFKNPEPKYQTTHLTTEEVRLLIKLCNSGYLTDKQTRVLNAFLFTCFTSLRISDVYRVNAKWQLTEGFLDFIPKKNEKAGKWVHVPLPEHAKDFVKNLNGHYFDLPNQVEYNLTLKDIAKTAGINKRLTSHVGRHTFGSMYISKVNSLPGLKEIMGHAKVDTTMRYVHLDDEYLSATSKQLGDEFKDLRKRKRL